MKRRTFLLHLTAWALASTLNGKKDEPVITGTFTEKPAQGDIYYTDSGYARLLPVSKSGQVLTVSSKGMPEWKTVPGDYTVTIESENAWK